MFGYDIDITDNDEVVGILYLSSNPYRAVDILNTDYTLLKRMASDSAYDFRLKAIVHKLLNIVKLVYKISLYPKHKPLYTDIENVMSDILLIDRDGEFDFICNHMHTHSNPRFRDIYTTLSSKYDEVVSHIK
jgi:hypothetical protein